jgi:RNA polymerase sigma-70 factor (ECF subfamily)
MEEHHEDLHYTNEGSQPDLKRIIDAGLATLPDVQRSVILLRDLEGYTYEEIAELTGLNLTQVKVYIYRGRTALKEYIGKLEIVL